MGYSCEAPLKNKLTDCSCPEATTKTYKPPPNAVLLEIVLINSKEKSEANPQTILRILPNEKGFHFNTEKGVYTGQTATSLEDFADKLKTLDIKSVSYHYYRGDFQRWISTTLGDREFSDKLCFIQTEITAEELRRELLKMLDSRITELKGLDWVENKGI